MVEIFEFEGKREEKLVLYARGGTRGIVLNKSSINQLVSILASDDTEHWVGKRVEVYNDRSVMYAGRAVGGIRFRALGQAAPAMRHAAPIAPAPHIVEPPSEETYPPAGAGEEFPPASEELPF